MAGCDTNVVADVSILDQAVHAAPKQYKITGAQDIVLRSVTATFDGTSAASSWVPVVQIIDPSGFTAATYPLGSTLLVGATADVSWFPGLGGSGSTAALSTMLMARVNIVGAQSITTGGNGQVVVWGEAPIDTGSPAPFFNIANPTRLTAPVTGDYFVFANLEFDILNEQTNLGCYLFKNGHSDPNAFLYEFNSGPVLSASGVGSNSYTLQGGQHNIWSLNAGDYLELVAYVQASAGVPGTLNLIDLRATQNHYSSFGMILLSGAAGPEGPQGGGLATVKDGSTTVTSANTLKFTSGATVTDGGGGLANVAITAATGTLVYDYTVTGADKASIDTNVDGTFAGLISNGYNLLEVFMYLRTDEAVVASAVNLNYNNDATASYERQRVRGSNVTASAGQVLADTKIQVLATGSTAGASIFGVVRMTLFNYASSVGYKPGEFTTTVPDSSTSAIVDLWASTWLSTSAINRLAITPATAGKLLKVGSRLTIYGR